MTMQVRVKIEVINEYGDVVDYRGYPDIRKTNNFSGLETSQIFREFETVEDAHAAMNKLFQVIDQIGSIK